MEVEDEDEYEGEGQDENEEEDENENEEASILSPQTEHSRPRIGRMPSRQSWQTGSRETRVSGSSQMRQFEGNMTAKIPSIGSLIHAGKSVSLLLLFSGFLRNFSLRLTSLQRTIECPAIGAVAWLARILSSLLLKTASSDPHAKNVGRRDALRGLSSSLSQYSGEPRP